MTDREIIQLFKQRDEEGIAETERIYGARLLRIAEGLLPREDAEECLNDLYQALWDHIPPDEPAHFLSYAVTILKNLARNRLRDMNVKKRFREIVTLSDELADILPDPKTDTEAEAIFHVSDVLNRFLEHEKPEKRRMFVLHYWYGQSVDEIAGKMGFSLAKVEKTLTRMKKKLKEAFREDN